MSDKRFIQLSPTTTYVVVNPEGTSDPTEKALMWLDDQIKDRENRLSNTRNRLINLSLACSDEKEVPTKWLRHELRKIIDERK